MAAYILSYFTLKQSQKEFTISFIPYHSLVTDKSHEQVQSRWKDGKCIFVFFCIEYNMELALMVESNICRSVLPQGAHK